jgi:hypothetical protein
MPQIQYEGKPRQAQPAAQPQAAQITGGGLKYQLQDSRADKQAPSTDQRDEDAVVRYQRKLQQEMNPRGGGQPALHSILEDLAGERRAPTGATAHFRPMPGDRPGRPDRTRERGEADEEYDAPDFSNLALGLALEEGRPGAGRWTTAGESPVTGLASLSLAELPKRGRLFLFTTPGGEVEITARSASRQSIRSGVHVGVVLVVLLAAGLVFRMGRRGRLAWLGGRAFSTALVAVGAIAVLLGVLPIAGLVAILVGVGIKIARASRRRGESAEEPILAETV